MTLGYYPMENCGRWDSVAVSYEQKPVGSTADK